jgi:hypothetical protein
MRHLFAGLGFIALGLWGMFAWWTSFGMVMRGLIPFALLGVGLVALLSSYYRLDGAAPEPGRGEQTEG